MSEQSEAARRRYWDALQALADAYSAGDFAALDRLHAEAAAARLAWHEVAR